MSNVLLNNSILAIYGFCLWKPSEIVLLTNRSKLFIKNAVRFILDNFSIVGFLFFSRIQVDSSHISLHFDSILSPKAPKYFILNVLKSSLILAYGPTGDRQKNVGNAGSFICRVPHFSTVKSCSIKSWTGVIILSNKNFKTEPPTCNTNLANLRAATLSPWQAKSTGMRH
jgi:hypothetical protein